MGKTGPHQINVVEGGLPEEVFVAAVIFSDTGAQGRGGCTAIDEDFFIVHGDVLHRKDGLGPETADDEIHLVLRHQPFHGVGGIGDIDELVGIGLDQLDLHFFAADLDASPGIDLIGRQGGARPMPFSLDKLHRTDHPDLDRPTPGGETHCQNDAKDKQPSPTQGHDLHCPSPFHVVCSRNALKETFYERSIHKGRRPRVNPVFVNRLEM